MNVGTTSFYKLLGGLFLCFLMGINTVFAQQSDRSSLVNLANNDLQIVGPSDQSTMKTALTISELLSDPINYEFLAFDTLRSKLHFQNEFKGFSAVHQPRKGIQTITKREGLPNNFVSDLVIDANRNIWLAQDVIGLVQFDGEKFSVFPEANGLVSDRILMLSPRDDYGVWVVTMDGISSFDGAVFHNWYFKEPLSSDYFTDVASSGDTLWLGTAGDGLWRVTNGKIEVFNQKSHALGGAHISKLLVDGNKLWVSFLNGKMNCLSGGFLKSYSFDKPLWSPLICKTKAGDIVLYSDKDHRLVYLDDNSALSIELDIDVSISDLLFQENEELWFISNDGELFMLSGQKLLHFDSSDGLPTYQINAAVFIEDDLWMAHNGGGLSIFRSTEYTFLDQEKSKLGNLYTNFVSSKGYVYLGGEDRIIRMTKEGKSVVSKLRGKKGSFAIAALSEDKEGTVWCSTFEGELFQENGSEFIYTRSLSDSLGLGVIDMDFDRKGNLWLATFNNGLYCLDNKGQLAKPELDIRFDEDILAVELDKYDKLWFGTQRGLYRQTESGFKSYDLSNFPYEDIMSLFVDSQGGIWIGAKRGVAYYDGEVFRFLNRNAGLLSDHIFSFAEDESGRVWCTAETGLNIIENAYDWKNIEIKSFTYEDGFNETDSYYGTSVIDAENRLWIIGINGLIVLETDMLDLNLKEDAIVSLDQVYVNGIAVDFFQLLDDRSRKVYLEDMKGDINLEEVKLKGNRTRRFSDKISLPNDLNSLSFAYSARHWSSNNKLEYRYRLIGLDKNWSKPTLENSVSFWKLKAGSSYRFEVQARLRGGEWTSSESVDFKIRTSWLSVIGRIILLLLAILVLLFTFREEIKTNIKRYYNTPIPERGPDLNIESKVSTISSESFDSLKTLALSFADEMMFYGEINNRLKQLSKNVGEEDQRLVKKMDLDIRIQSDLSGRWERFMLDFNKVHPNFTKNLKDSFSGLSDREHHICILILSGLSNSQISNIMLIQTDSVKKSRHRINKKINDSDLDLLAYLSCFTDEKLKSPKV